MSKYVPSIRFDDFTEKWEKRKFLENIDKIIDFRGRTPKKLGMEWSESGYLALSALNVKNGYIDYSADAHYGDEKLYSKWMSGSELKEGQVLFTMEAPMGNVAQVPDNRGYILSQRTIAFIVNKDLIINDFLAVLLRTPKVFNNLSALSSGGTAKGVSQKSLKGLKVILPKDKAEQEKIGSFFNHLDKLIELNQHALDLLKQRKKAFLQKMFPKKGESVPEIRFSVFKGDWKTYQIDEVTDIYDNLRKPVAASKRISGKFPYYGANGIQDYVEGFTHNGEFVLVAEDGASDLIHYPVNYVNGKVWVNNHAHVLSGKSNIVNNLFLAMRIKSMNVYKYLVGGGRAKLNGSVLKKIKINIPTYEEQEKIGKFFRELDNSITLQEEKLESLKQMKKAFLQKMFV